MNAVVENDNDLFALVRNGKIVEFPVYRRYIKNRAHPVSFYTPVIDDPKPEAPDFHYVQQVLTVEETFVRRSWEIKELSIDQLLIQLHGNEFRETPLTIAEVDPVIINRVYDLVGHWVTDRLNVFAQTKKYDSIDSLIGKYRDSRIARLKAESDRGRELLDDTWEALFGYFDGVMNGTLPVPRSLAEIETYMPVLSWESQPV